MTPLMILPLLFHLLPEPPFCPKYADAWSRAVIHIDQAWAGVSYLVLSGVGNARLQVGLVDVFDSRIQISGSSGLQR